MKKLLLSLSALVLGAMTVGAQTRLSLYEEFSGENCAPCAAYNPGLITLLNSGSNPGKIMLIKYQSPIPSAGPIYNLYTTVTNARLSYYSVSSAPTGIQNGNEVSGNIANYTQASITAAAAVASPFNLSVTHTWNSTGDSVTANVNITALSAFAPAGANLKLRIAVIEHLTYATAPGTNGETDFHNVVREMVPNAGGTQLLNSWTAAQTQSYTIKGKMPAFVDKSNSSVVLVAWIQDDATKDISQAATSTFVPLVQDAGITGIIPTSTFTCAASTSSIASTVVIKNTASTLLTSAKIYYRADNGAYTSMNWTGSLVQGATATVTIPAIALSPGTRTIIDSIALPNGAADMNQGNNVTSTKVTVYNNTGTAATVSSGFENAGATPAGWILYDQNSNGKNWQILYSGSAANNIGHNSSAWLLAYPNFSYDKGEANYVILPASTIPAGSKKALNFYHAYAQLQGTENDKLEVVYSTDCGVSWTSVWSDQGTATLSTHAAMSTAAYIPTQDEWKGHSVDMTSVPSTAMVALRATSDGGNYLFVDDVTLREGPVNVATIINNNTVSLYPNPAREAAMLDFSLVKSGKVTVSVLDAVGRTISIVSDATMQQGAQHVVVPTSSLAAGVYSIAIRTEEGTLTQRLSVVK